MLTLISIHIHTRTCKVSCRKPLSSHLISYFSQIFSLIRLAQSGGPSKAGSGSQKNYADALAKSILFYDTQRSGRLPADNPIPWRGRHEQSIWNRFFSLSRRPKYMDVKDYKLQRNWQSQHLYMVFKKFIKKRDASGNFNICKSVYRFYTAFYSIISECRKSRDLKRSTPVY